MHVENFYEDILEEKPQVRRKRKRRQDNEWVDDLYSTYEGDFEDEFKPRKRRKDDWDAERQARKAKKRKNRRPRQDEF